MAGALALALLLGTGVSRAATDGSVYPYCPPDQTPTFSLGFGTLQAQLGSLMGDPLECEHTDPRSGNVVQQTSTGLAVFQDDGTSSFVAGSKRWVLSNGQLSAWPGYLDTATAGTAGDPAADGDAPLQAASTPSSGRAIAPLLNGRFLIVNQHGALFHEDPADQREEVAYAAWLGAGVIRVFATDNNTLKPWDGQRVAQAINAYAPVLRANKMKLIVAFVNNHRPVPGEQASSFGMMDNYWQLLEPWYDGNWRGAYLTFVRDLVSTVQADGNLDVIAAWELGNELHTPRDPVQIVSFVQQAAAEVHQLDASTPLLPGTMGANHLQPWNQQSPIARWLYCQAPVDAYTLHAYDFVSPERAGDMPINWDLDNIVSQPCPSGRQLPVIVEELGTSRALPGVYAATDEQSRLNLERSQLQYVLKYPQVAGVGVWNGESPRLHDHNFNDDRRGLTSYGANALGGGSCYDPTPETAPGARCQLEKMLQALPNE